MVYFIQLPIEVLELILMLLAVSPNGAKEIATISSTCKLFKQLAAGIHILREINFRCLSSIEDFSMHHHPRDLICVCAQMGNMAARTIFAKALLYNDAWFKQMIAVSNQEALDNMVLYHELLDYHSLIKSFIRYASYGDLIKMQGHLLNYVTSFVGFKVANRFGILNAIHDMCYEMSRVLQLHYATSLHLTGSATVLPAAYRYHMRDERKKLVDLFDKVFPSKPA
ncbi:uncharacterized protein LOC143542190 [Bidens hawaiensis]|uniref:uncharacterized protein LOC143542190 n=1 Tax=Bidens hawaiensis TaxID=980011 RepID=UPI00404A932A